MTGEDKERELLFAIVVDVMNEIKKGTLQQILHADDIVLIAEIMAELQEKLYGWKNALESKDLKVNMMKTKVMVSKIGQVTVKPSSKKDTCGICGRKTMLNAVLCKPCGMDGQNSENVKIYFAERNFL